MDIVAGAEASGTSKAFSGAELEYVIFGSNSEIANQVYAFFALYVLRLVFDAAPVMLSAEVARMAAASAFAAPFVYLAVMLAEPLTDVLLLAGKGSVPMIKTSLHLTPSGVVPFALAALDLNAGGSKEALERAFGVEINGVPSAAGLLGLNYRDHCFIYLFTSVSKSRQYERLARVVQMEADNHYSKLSIKFDLREAYTFVNGHAQADFRSVISLAAPFSARRVQQRGY
jgi:hypothetical protein